MSLTILTPRRWSVKAILHGRRHPGRKPGTLPAPWVDELFQKRFGCILSCQPCAWKYGDAFGRHGYRRDPEFVGIARCDFCKTEDRTLWLYFAEEKFRQLRNTVQDRRGELQRGAIYAAGGLGMRLNQKEGRIHQWKL